MYACICPRNKAICTCKLLYFRRNGDKVMCTWMLAKCIRSSDQLLSLCGVMLPKHSIGLGPKCYDKTMKLF